METIFTPMVIESFVFIALAAVIAPWISDKSRRWVLIPTVVLEILLGLIVGPAGLGWVQESDIVSVVSSVGMAMLFFLAGFEINMRSIRGRPIGFALLGWLASALLVFTLVMLFSHNWMLAIILAVGMSSTALGTILPIARDAGLLKTPMGTPLLAVGAVGELCPIIVIAIFFSTHTHPWSTNAVATVVILVVTVVILSMLRGSATVTRLLSATLSTSAQFAIRLSILGLLLAVLLTAAIGVDIALGAIAAGVLARLVVSTLSDLEVEVVSSKLDAIGYGWLVPFFFVYTGVTFPIEQLLGSTTAMILLPVFLIGFLIIRGTSVAMISGFGLESPHKRALGLMGAVQLPIVIIATQIGVEQGLLTEPIGASMVGAGLVSVLMFPLMAMKRITVAATQGKLTQ